MVAGLDQPLRAQPHLGQDNRTALSNALGSSGTAVLLAGGTVVVAMTALVLTGVGFLTSVGLSTSLVVLFAVASALTLLPALLSLLGDRVDAGRVRRRRPAKRAEQTVWWRFAHRVSGRPWPYLIGAAVARWPVQSRRGIPDRLPAARDLLRGPVRPVHRLRGVPALADPGGVRRHR